MIRGVFFDFDGLILDTEMPEVRAWRESFEAHGLEFPDSIWMEMIGKNIEQAALHPADVLIGQALNPPEREAIIEEHRLRRLQLIEEESVRPGVIDRVEEAREFGLDVAVVSSSSRGWVEGYLSRLGLSEALPLRFCGREGLPSKPAPELYEAALRHFDLAPNEAFTFEDSPNGLRSAKAAGIWAVAIPNELTSLMDLSLADVSYPSLDAVRIAELVERFR